MLTLQNGQAALCCTRRDFLRTGGGFALSGLVLPPLHAQGPSQVRSSLPNTAAGPAKSCILIYLLGGPPHLDMWDLKPEAPAEIRGPFRPISTNLPGTQICEHFPRLAAMAHQYALIRSVSHRNSNHTPMIYYTLTGYDTALPEQDNDTRAPQRTDFPHIGSVLAKFRRSSNPLPDYLAMPEVQVRSSIRGEYKRARTLLRGGNAGFLGPRYDPFALNGDPTTSDALETLALPKDVSAERFEQRLSVLSLLDRRLSRTPTAEQLAIHRQRAIALTGAAHSDGRRVFSLDDEPARCRDRYGRHRFGQALLLARRLAEADVPMIAIHYNEMTLCDGWDTHSKNFEALESELLPMLDQGLSALIEDLDARGRLGETLIICMGEFGRTPKINPNAGRDHWGDCSSTLLAGGGIRGGQVYGASDRNAAYPRLDPVDPIDIHATLYHLMGLDPQQLMHDSLGRGFPISNGNILRRLIYSLRGPK